MPTRIDIEKPLSSFVTRKAPVVSQNVYSVHQERSFDSIPSMPNSAASSSTKLVKTEHKKIKKNSFLQKSTSAKWSPQKKKKCLIIGLIIGAVACAIILIIVLAVVLTRSSGTTTSTISAAWTFDQTTVDTYGVYNGALMGGATYSSASSQVPYLGTGRALSLTSSSSQYFLVSSPFLSLAYTSFTVEAWIYATSLTTDQGIFGQCQCGTCSNQCLYMDIRSSKLYMGFTSNDISGNATLSTSTWYHVAFVYNYASQQQILYLNGVQDSIRSSASAYQGTNGSMQIGVVQIYTSSYYFGGYIDNVKVTTRAKSASEILNAASLIAYYAFDISNANGDSGPNGLTGNSTNTASVSGRVNQALRFSGSSSYFQAYGFYQLSFTVISGPFTIGMWINPTSATSCTIVQASYNPTSSYTTFNLIGLLQNNAATAAQITIGSSYGSTLLVGPFITLNSWTHVLYTYSLTSGVILYINGVSYGPSGSFTYSASGSMGYLIIGYGASYTWGTNTAYQGSVDEVYVYNRVLAQSEITTISNP